MDAELKTLFKPVPVASGGCAPGILVDAATAESKKLDRGIFYLFSKLPIILTRKDLNVCREVLKLFKQFGATKVRKISSASAKLENQVDTLSKTYGNNIGGNFWVAHETSVSAFEIDVSSRPPKRLRFNKISNAPVSDVCEVGNLMKKGKILAETKTLSSTVYRARKDWTAMVNLTNKFGYDLGQTVAVLISESPRFANNLVCAADSVPTIIKEYGPNTKIRVRNGQTTKVIGALRISEPAGLKLDKVRVPMYLAGRSSNLWECAAAKEGAKIGDASYASLRRQSKSQHALCPLDRARIIRQGLDKLVLAPELKSVIEPILVGRLKRKVACARVSLVDVCPTTSKSWFASD
jgi:hypothetical protein